MRGSRGIPTLCIYICVYATLQSENLFATTFPRNRKEDYAANEFVARARAREITAQCMLNDIYTKLSCRNCETLPAKCSRSNYILSRETRQGGRGGKKSFVVLIHRNRTIAFAVSL